MWSFRLFSRPLILLALVLGVLVTTLYQDQVDFPVGAVVEDPANLYENGTIRNLRLAFIGDCVSRYQYLDLYDR
jgi:hypothetical protein